MQRPRTIVSTWNDHLLLHSRRSLGRTLIAPCRTQYRCKSGSLPVV